VILSQKC